MARLFSSGFELNSAVNLVEFLTTGTPTISSSVVRSGSYSGRISGLAGGVRQYFSHQFIASAGTGPYYARFYLRIATAPSALNRIAIFGSSATAGIGVISLTSGRQLRLGNGGTQVGSDSSALDLDTWYRVEMLFDRTPAGGSQVLRGYIDGVEFAGASNLTLSSSVSYLTIGGNLSQEAQTQGDWYFDDLAINDSSGSVQNGLAGAGKIVHAYPNAAGDSNTWLKSNGAAGDSNNYTQVNEVTPDDATTYLRRTTTTIKVDDYNVQNASDVGIGSSNPITLVSVGARVGATSNTANSARNVLYRIKGQASGTVLKSGSVDASISGWRTNSDPVPRNYRLTAYTNPQDSSAWTASTIDSMQIGIETATSSTTEVRVSTMWALIEYLETLPTSSLTDDFSGGSMDTAKWSALGAGGTQSGGTVSFTTSINSTDYPMYESVNSYNLTGSYAFCEVVNAGNQSLEFMQAIPVQVRQNASNSLSFFIGTGKVVAQQQVSDVFTGLDETLTYDSAVHKFFRIRESGGTVYWEYSTNGTDWTTYHSKANPINTTLVKLQIGAGTWDWEASTSTVVLDNFNLVVEGGGVNTTNFFQFF